MVPLLTLPLEGQQADNSKGEAVAACVLRFGSDFKGSIVLCGDKPGGKAGAIDEETQARYLTRAMAIAFAKGVEGYFWYEFRAPEDDPIYSEDHFGLTHADMTPKPAWGAYRAFVARRPPESVQRSVPLRDPATGVWRSEWTRPDGTVAGVFWAPGDIEDPVFYEGAAFAR